MIETLAEARDSRMTLTARCAWGRREGTKSIRECKARVEIDLETLIWTRGESFPISMLESRLKCPRCGSRRVVLMFGLPGIPMSRAAE
jgi:DNA-directed RNA polymerase subunit RPC12/RpoP